MSRLLRKFWSDDCGALLASEFVFMYTMLIAGTVSGLVAVRQAAVSELTGVANSIMSLNQSYSFSGQRNGAASTAGSSAVDQTNTIPATSVPAVPAVPAPNAAMSRVPCE
jgi:hypothetical protein